MNDDQWEALWAKHGALYEYLQALNSQLLPADRSDYEGDISNAQLEMQRIEAIMNLAANNAPVPLPSDAEIKALQKATGKLEQAVKGGAQVVDLIEAADEVIATWPISSR